ncbi:MAG: hypothetical protein QOF71_1383 [Candidatus Eremiobacteraeota bacterium]|jgi:hypothetical protein|nr:hypothetical protein [Candidatus Eremiobacteraeota bacterium]
MDSGLPARHFRARLKSKPHQDRLNAVEVLVVALSLLALIDCAVIGWLVVHGLGS